MNDGTLKNEVAEFMQLLEFEKEAEASLLASFDRIWAHPACRDRLLAIVNLYRERMILRPYMVDEAADRCADNLGGNRFGYEMVLFLCPAVYSYGAFEKKGLSRNVWIDTMADFRFKLQECRKLYGEWGTFVNWFEAFYYASRIAFGRLQFELDRVGDECSASALGLKPNQRVIGVHIPSNERVPLSKEECDRAYEAAARYFMPYLEENEPVFKCESWLLYEGMKDILPARSNILRFASEYVIVDRKSSLEDLWRVFYVREYDGNPATLPEATALQRGFKRLLKEGKTPEVALGYRFG